MSSASNSGFPHEMDRMAGPYDLGYNALREYPLSGESFSRAYRLKFCEADPDGSENLSGNSIDHERDGNSLRGLFP